MRDEQFDPFPAGAVDINVHYGPDVVPRSQTAAESVRLATELALTGYCLRSHTGSTVDIANALNALSDSVEIVGALTLNTPVGGINPEAVDVALRTGARMISLPTWDAEGETAPPLRRRAPVPVMDSNDLCLPEVDEVFAMVAEANVCLDIGIALAQHVLPLIRRARFHGVTRIIVSHPFYAAQRYPLQLQMAAVEAGAMIEHCYMQFDPGYPRNAEIKTLAHHVRQLGASHVVLSSDSGKDQFPTLRRALVMFHRLLQRTCSDDELTRMFVENPSELLGLASR